MAKKNRIVSYNKMEPDLVKLVCETFPHGYENMVKLFNLGVGRSFYAFDLMTKECNYLIKVDLDVDLLMECSNDEEAMNEESDLD